MALNKITTRLRFLIIGFFLLNLFFKTVNIQANPSALTYDEVIYAAEAQSIVKYGSDLIGDWRPWHLEPSDSYYTELTSTVLVPGFILFPNNPVFASKFVPLLLGSLIPVLLGLIAFKLRKEKSVFILTTLIATFNPWIFQFSRMGYDSLFSIGFYLIGITFVLYLKKWQKLWAIIPLFIGFFQYQGHKPLLVPLISLCLVYLIIDKYKVTELLSKFKKIINDKNLIATLLVLIFSFLLTTIYLVRLPKLSSGERISEFSIFSEEDLSSEVNDSRRMSFDSPLNSLFTNKFTVLTTTLLGRFLNSFNLNRLFIEGDASIDTFTVLDYGFFHQLDIVVIAIALIFMFANKKDYRIAVFVLGFILIGTLPNVIRTGQSWITLRGAFVFLGLVLVMGIGSSSFLKLINKNIVAILIAIYLLAITPFLFVYFFRYPITHTKNVGFYERIVASYVKRIGSDETIYIIPDRDDATFVYQIHYNQLLNDQNQEQVSLSMKNREFEIDNLKIEGGCSEMVKDLDGSTVIIFLTKYCEPKNDPSQTTEIKSLIDTGTIFTIYNDKLCSQYELTPYPRVKGNVMAVEKLSNQEFCENFFSRN